MESTKGRDCPIWSEIEAISGNKGIYSTTCDDSCTRFSAAYGTCIDFAEKQANIQKNLGKYK